MAVENPEDWPDAQRQFHLAYLDDPTAFARREVELVWITRPDTAWNLDVVTGRHDGVEATVTEVGGDHRSLRFSVAPDQVPPRRGGRVPGVLVGDWGTNATLCVEVEGGVVWPAYNPEVITTRAAATGRGAARQQHSRPSPKVRGLEPPAARWLALPRLVRALLVASALIAIVLTRWARGSRIGGHPVSWAGPWFYAALAALLLLLRWVTRGPRGDPPNGS